MDDFKWRIRVLGNLADPLQVAIKRIDGYASKRLFLSEYKTLKQVNLINHSNLVQTLGAFIQETGERKHYNLVFPLAVGHLGQLFRGQIEGDHAFIGQRKSLANQFVGLASGLAYLHESSIAHRDIKPSNILLYQEEDSRAIKMRIADFGLSVDLTTCRDEVTTASSTTTTSKVWHTEAYDVTAPPKRATILRPETLFSEDTWDLGCVFTELLAYMCDGGAQGVARLREAITTSDSQISSDEFSEPLAGDGRQIKSQVFDWISEASKKDHMARELQPILRKMFAEPSSRVTSRQWNSHDLSIALSPDEAKRYKALCVPLQAANSPPLLPLTSVPGGAGHSSSASMPQMSSQVYKTDSARGRPVDPGAPGQPGGSGSPGQRGTRPLAQSPPPRLTTTIYCCMDTPYRELVDKRVYSVTRVEEIRNDKAFYTKVRELIRNSKGSNILSRWIFRGLYWKTCTEVEFIKFHIIRDNRESVLRDGCELPQRKDGYEHSMPKPENLQMRLMAAQIVQGLANPADAAGERRAVQALPKKLIPPPRILRMGEPGWGIELRMGFSPWKFGCWLCICAFLTLGFVVLWLVLVNKTDLPAAFVPVNFVLNIVTLTFAVMQMG
ncbi:uncharacterized protein PG998_002745 [Apiospora kogelbergensis]|uniref:uncharacterized protein n=1 Tax=Apiospora kogelbergensis TaxID=1337665 RepID=UPI00312FD959